MIDEINVCLRLHLKYPQQRLLGHVIVNHPGYEAQGSIQPFLQFPAELVTFYTFEKRDPPWAKCHCQSSWITRLMDLNLGHPGSIQPFFAVSCQTAHILHI